MLRKETTFLDKAEHLVFEIYKNVTSSQTIKRYTQNQSLKWTQRTMGKTISILQRVISVFKIQDNQRTVLNSVLGLWPKKFEFQKKIISKIDISLISFQHLDLNRHDRWNVRFDSITRKIFKQEHQLSLQNPWQKWHQHFSTLLETLTTWGQYSGPLEEKQTTFWSVGGKERIRWWVDKVHQSYV